MPGEVHIVTAVRSLHDNTLDWTIFISIYKLNSTSIDNKYFIVFINKK